MKKIFFLFVLLSVSLNAQWLKINQIRDLADSLQAKINKKDSTLYTSLYRAQIIARDSSLAAQNRAQDYTDSRLAANPYGWQTKSQVESIAGDSTVVLRGLINSSGITISQAKQAAIDTIKVISIENTEPSGSTYAIVNSGGTLKRVLLSNLPMQTQVALQFQALLDSIARLRASIDGVTPTNPLPVTNLQATAGDEVVTLTWTNPSPLDSVVIERASSLTGAVNFIRLVNVGTNNTYTDSNLTNSVTYTYRLRVYYQGFASAGVTVDATPQAPRREFFFTISPTSINFNNLGGSGRESGNVGDAETGDLSFFDSVYTNGGVNGSITATQTNKVNGNYGYKFTWNGASSQALWARKPITHPDSICVRFYVKMPADYPYSDTALSTMQVLRLTRNNLTESVDLGGLIVRTGSTGKYLLRIGVRNSGSTFIYTLPTSTYNFPTDTAVCLEYRFVRGSGNGRVTVLFNNTIIYDTTGLTNNDYDIGYVRFGNQGGGFTRTGEYIIIDDIKISKQPIGVFNASNNQAIVTVKNDSTFAMDLFATTTRPFTVNNSDNYETSIPAGDSLQLVLSVDSVGLAQGLYTSNLLLSNSRSSQTVSLQFFKSPSSSDSVEGSKAWFVDKLATGLNNGTSWTNAWTSFSAINWNTMQAGDTLYISGGGDSLVYTENIVLGRGNITLTKGKSVGHNGRVIIKSPVPKSNIGIDIRGGGKNAVAITDIELHNWRYGIYIRGSYDSIKVQNCKVISSGSAFLNTWGGDTLGTQKNLYILNNYIETDPTGTSLTATTEGQTDGLSIWYVTNSFVIGNIFINKNERVLDNHTDFIQGDYNTNLYIFNNFFVHTNQNTSGQNGVSGFSSGGGDYYVANNIVVQGNYTNNSPVWVNDDLIRTWGKIRILNNTFICGHHRMMLIGHDSTAVIKNNIFYATGTYSGSTFGRSYFISIDQTPSGVYTIPNNHLVIKHNNFYAWYDTATIKYLSPSLNGNPPQRDGTNGYYYPMYSGGVYKPSFVNFPTFTSQIISYNTATFPYSLNPQDYRLTSSSVREIGAAEVLQEADFTTNNLAPSWFKAWDYIKKDFNGVERGASWDIGAFEYVP